MRESGLLLAMIPVLVPVNFSFVSTPRPRSGSPGLGGAAGHCRT